MPEAGHTPEHKEDGDAHLAETTGHGDAHAVADSHGHGDAHAVPADIIKEGSLQDAVLSWMALAVGCLLVGLIVYWCGLKPAVVTEREPAEHHALPQEAPVTTQPAPTNTESAPANTESAPANTQSTPANTEPAPVR